MEIKVELAKHVVEIKLMSVKFKDPTIRMIFQYYNS
jgi:hypothetical protein